METSNLSHIINTPDTPMPLFVQYYNEAMEFSDPNTFSNAMCIASLSDDDEILNRNVLLRKYDDNGWIFVTERNTKKYKDFMKNPSAAVTFLWVYMMNQTLITRQIRATGKVTELNEAEIAEFYKDEPLFAKIRSKICRCGEPVDWNELKAAHDKVLNDYKEGRDALLQGANYTAMRITPQKVDFYFTKKDEIADRLKYTLDDGKWTSYHIAP